MFHALSIVEKAHDAVILQAWQVAGGMAGGIIAFHCSPVAFLAGLAGGLSYTFVFL